MHSFLYSRPSWSEISFYGRSLAYDHGNGWWTRYDTRAGEHLADLLEAQSFIATPISLKKEKGWLCVSSRTRSFKKVDALFLNHIASQAFPVIENIQLLDRLASDAAQQERKRISWNIHDSAIQPFIGLKLGLSALRNKADPDNPLVRDLERLMERASQIAADLRHYAGIIRDDPRQTESVCVDTLHWQAAQLKELYGIDIKVCVEDGLRINDRLAVEVLQIAKEGLSNICKHTTAQRGTVRIQSQNARLSMQIENESEQNSPIRFLPRSIAERAAVLGGSTHVERGTNGATVVRVEIPI
jgi:signal transduction histidine kinase